jgi:hypothetical protein
VAVFENRDGVATRDRVDDMNGRAWFFGPFDDYRTAREFAESCNKYPLSLDVTITIRALQTVTIATPAERFDFVLGT